MHLTVEMDTVMLFQVLINCSKAFRKDDRRREAILIID
jgi:hypothetical protein